MFVPAVDFLRSGPLPVYDGIKVSQLTEPCGGFMVKDFSIGHTHLSN